MMSSATLTRRRAGSGSPGAGAAPEAPAESRQPYRVFLAAGVLLAVAAIVILRGQDPASVSLVALTLLAAGLTGVALFRVLAPLTSAGTSGSPLIGGRRRAALERDKLLTLRSIKELEFDRAMGKVSEPDFVEMRDRLRARALRLMRQLEGASLYRQMIEQDLGRTQPLDASRASGSSRARSRDDRLGAALGPVEGQGAATNTPIAPTSTSAAPASTPDVAEGMRTAPVACLACGTANDPDARFCKRCGERLARSAES
jgi:hypothetical protein